MASVTGYTKDRMKAIEDNTVVDGDIVGDNLILTRHGGATIDAGDVRGPAGPQGPGGIPNDDSVTTGKVQDLAITTAKLANDAVNGSKIANDSINSEHYADGSIDNAHLANDAVNGSKIANESINSEHYVDGSIDRAHLSADIIDSTKLANDSVNSEHYVNGSIDNEHLAVSSVTSTRIASGAVNITQLNSTSWAAIPLQNDWENFGGRQVPQWRRVADEIQLRGTVRAPGDVPTGSYIGYLPTGSRPIAQDNYAATGTGASPGMYLTVETSGAIRVYNNLDDDPVAAISLSGIRFSLTA